MDHRDRHPLFDDFMHEVRLRIGHLYLFHLVLDFWDFNDSVHWHFAILNAVLVLDPLSKFYSWHLDDSFLDFNLGDVDHTILYNCVGNFLDFLPDFNLWNFNNVLLVLVLGTSIKRSTISGFG